MSFVTKHPIKKARGLDLLKRSDIPTEPLTNITSAYCHFEEEEAS